MLQKPDDAAEAAAALGQDGSDPAGDAGAVQDALAEAAAGQSEYDAQRAEFMESLMSGLGIGPPKEGEPEKSAEQLAAERMQALEAENAYLHMREILREKMPGVSKGEIHNILTAEKDSGNIEAFTEGGVAKFGQKIDAFIRAYRGSQEAKSEAEWPGGPTVETHSTAQPTNVGQPGTMSEAGAAFVERIQQ